MARTQWRAGSIRRSPSATANKAGGVLKWALMKPRRFHRPPPAVQYARARRALTAKRRPPFTRTGWFVPDGGASDDLRRAVELRTGQPLAEAGRNSASPRSLLSRLPKKANALWRHRTCGHQADNRLVLPSETADWRHRREACHAVELSQRR